MGRDLGSVFVAWHIPHPMSRIFGASMGVAPAVHAMFSGMSREAVRVVLPICCWGSEVVCYDGDNLWEVPDSCLTHPIHPLSCRN